MFNSLGVNANLSLYVASYPGTLLISATDDLIILFEAEQDISVPVIGKELKDGQLSDVLSTRDDKNNRVTIPWLFKHLRVKKPQIILDKLK